MGSRRSAKMAQTSGDGRRTWDREDAESKHKERLESEKAKAKSKKAGKAGMGKLPPPASTDNSSIQARTEAVIKVEELHGKRELVAPLLGFGNKGKSAGFYCETCDLTYKDSLSYLDHINSSERMSLWQSGVNCRLSKIGNFRQSRKGDVGTGASTAGMAQRTKD